MISSEERLGSTIGRYSSLDMSCLYYGKQKHRKTFLSHLTSTAICARKLAKRKQKNKMSELTVRAGIKRCPS